MSNYLRRRRRDEKKQSSPLATRWDTLADALRRAAQDRAGEAQPPAGGNASPKPERVAGATG